VRSTKLVGTSSTCKTALNNLYCNSFCDPNAGTWSNATHITLLASYVDSLFCECVSKNATVAATITTNAGA
jgi:hypothetical protein